MDEVKKISANRQKKIAIVADLNQKLARAKAVIFTNYQGTTHKQLETLKRAIKPLDAEYVVAKNSLILRALDENKIKLLQESGLLVDCLDQHWNAEYNQVAEFIKKHNRLPSAHSRDPKESSLGTWRLFQTQRYKKGLISETKGQQLEALGLANRIMDNLWNDNFEKAKNIIVPRLKAGQLYGRKGLLQSLGKELYTWWDNNRRKYFCGKLSKDRMKLFEKYKMTLRVCELNKIYKKSG